MRRTTLAVALLVLAGCAEKTVPTVKLAGTVTVGGKKLPQGTIVLHRADQDGASPVAAAITDGRFEAPVVPAGKYKAAFTTDLQAEPTGPVDSSFATPDPNRAKTQQNRIPERYRTPSVPVDATADNTSLVFDLETK